MIGETIGNFRVISKLGAGGMGEVWLAEQKAIGTKVAIKMLRPEISADTQHVERFFNEARAVSRIKHAGIVKIFDVGHHTTGHAYLVMEFLEGETLSSRIVRTGKLPLAQISDIGKQIASILEATHSAGITHRDLKPDNVFLVPDSELASQERVKILDFGIAKLSGQTAAGGPRTVGTMGTPAYMAPEQWGDASKVDWRADIYSLGCVTFEMAAGRPPFVTSNFAEACGKHLGEAPPKLRTLVAVPEALETLVDAMLAKSPYGRPPLRDVGKRFADLGIGQARGFDETLPPRRSSTPLPVAPDAPTHTPVVHQPTPVNQQAPVPAVSSELEQQTTLSSAAGVTRTPPKKSRAPLYAIGGLVVVGGGIAAIVAASSGGGGKKHVATPADAAIAVVDAAVASVDAAPAIDAAPTWTPPPFVELAGLQVMEHQVTRGEYLDYLHSLAAASRSAQEPLKAWSPKPERLDEPVAFVSFERARKFCQAAGGDLPTQEQWLKASGGTWRIGKTGDVIREWTSTVTSDGLVIVMGGTSKMPDAARTQAIKNPLSKPTEASAGKDPAPETISAATIGIRCIKGGAQTSTPPPKPQGGCDSIAQLEDEAKRLFSVGSHAAALATLEKGLDCKPLPANYLARTVLAACMAKNTAKAKQLFARLPESERTRSSEACLKQGIQLAAASSAVGTYASCLGSCGCRPRLHAPTITADRVNNECGNSSALVVEGTTLKATDWGVTATVAADGTVVWNTGCRWSRKESALTINLCKPTSDPYVNGKIREGYSCNEPGDCAPGLVCADDRGDNHYYCKPRCDDGTDANCNTAANQRCFDATSTAGGRTLKICNTGSNAHYKQP